MRRLTCILILALAASAVMAQTTAQKTEPKTEPKKSRRARSTSRVITNEDVRKSKGKVIELPAKGQEPATPEATLAERHAALQAARKSAGERLTRAEEDVAALNKELARLERAYLEEDDLDVRDTVIARQFAATRVKADAANAELEAARKALAELPEKP